MKFQVRTAKSWISGTRWELIGARLQLGVWGSGPYCVSFPSNLCIFPFLLLDAKKYKGISTNKCSQQIAGFIRRVQGVSSSNGWDNIYNLSYFFGFIVSGFLHWTLHTLFPAPKQTGGSPFVMELHAPRIDVVAFEDSHPAYGSVDVESEAYIIGEEKEGNLEYV